MELKLVILSLACFSCLVPPALGTSLMAAKAAAVGAGIVAKGALLKGAAVLGAKAAVKGAALLAAKGLAAKGALAAGAAAVGTHVVHHLPEKPSIQVQIPETTIVVEPPSLSTIFERLSNLIGTVHTAAKEKTMAVGSLLAALLPSKSIVVKPPHPEVVVEHDVIVRPEMVIPPPLLMPRPAFIMPLPPPPPPQVIHPQPPVAIVGPTMNVYQHPHNDAYYPVPVLEKDC
ncbi:unnamed protein product [Chilo suppressalis]|uniref:Uncharacterized protein n=1 Tax=Chilo suppressalis TaxID=168631 RepID=A0ABN8AY93_CHISP|nr:hypothetical protein evm_007632 [Chilo suppressalis]CAH0401330.1 unnamed protein product [Chilo suppressalis]